MSEKRFEYPKMQLIFSIQNHDEKIIWFLENGKYLNAGRSLHYLLGRIEISNLPEDNKIRELKEAITIENYHLLTKQEFDEAYDTLHEFLNRTYYKGFSNNRPSSRTSTIQKIGADINDRT